MDDEFLATAVAIALFTLIFVLLAAVAKSSL